MLSKTRGMPVNSPAPGVIPDTITGPVSNGAPVAPARPTAQTATGRETRSGRFRRKAHRISARFHWRTRAPRRQGDGGS
jgi:hypothetical protein